MSCLFENKSHLVLSKGKYNQDYEDISGLTYYIKTYNL